MISIDPLGTALDVLAIDERDERRSNRAGPPTGTRATFDQIDVDIVLPQTPSRGQTGHAGTHDDDSHASDQPPVMVAAICDDDSPDLRST